MRSAVVILFVLLVSGRSSAEMVTFTRTVQATRGESNPVNTTITVLQRAYVSVRVTGTISLEPGVSVVDGRGAIRGTTRANGMTFGAPVVVIGGVHWSIEGGSRTWTSPHSGDISLYIADNYSSDNTGSYTFTIEVGDRLAGDCDGDTLDDAFEDDVLTLFAPQLRFDDSEDTWPSTVLWHARLSSVAPPAGLLGCNPDLPLISQEGHVPFYPEWHIALSSDGLCYPDSERDRNRHSNIMDYGGTSQTQLGDNQNITPSSWRMGHDDNWRAGEGRVRLEQSGGRLGMYGRVAPLSAFSELNPPNASISVLIVSYFQCFSYSDIDISGPDLGDHEGEWEYLDIYVRFDENDPTQSLRLSSMIGVKWWAHGKRVEWWRAGYVPENVPGPNPCPGVPSARVIVTGRGTSNEGTFYDHISGIENCCAQVRGSWPVISTTHVPAFIQPHGHGFFPTWFEYKIDIGGFNCVGNADAGGTGLRITPAEVANLGELYRPRLGMEIACHYSGRWGASSTLDVGDRPPGPVTRARHWPQRARRSDINNDSVLSPAKQNAYLGKWNHGRSLPFGLQAPIGRISWPYQSFAQAAAATSSNSHLIIYPGSFPAANVVVDRPMTISAPHGNVVIGTSN